MREALSKSEVLALSGLPPEPEWLEALQVLSLRDGDVIVVRVKQRLSKDLVQRIIDTLQEQLGAFMAERGIRFKCIVLEDGMEIGVLRGEPGA